MNTSRNYTVRPCFFSSCIFWDLFFFFKNFSQHFAWKFKTRELVAFKDLWKEINEMELGWGFRVSTFDDSEMIVGWKEEGLHTKRCQKMKPSFLFTKTVKNPTNLIILSKKFQNDQTKPKTTNYCANHPVVQFPATVSIPYPQYASEILSTPVANWNTPNSYSEPIKFRYIPVIINWCRISQFQSWIL